MKYPIYSSRKPLEYNIKDWIINKVIVRSINYILDIKHANGNIKSAIKGY